MSTQTAAARTAPRTLWRNRDFLALWGGQIVSSLGSRTSATALPLLVLAVTRSPADAGIVGAAAAVPFLISLPSGAFVDRWNRRRILLVSEGTAGLALAGIPVALWLHALTVFQLAVTAFVQGCCAVFFNLAEHAALPRIVPASQLGAAVAQNEAKARGASLLGPPLGGLLFGIARTLPFVADAVTYLISTVGLLFIRGDLQGERGGAKQSLLRETVEGLRWIWRRPFIRAAVLLIAMSNMVFQALILVMVVLVQRRGVPSAQIGLMLGIYGGGGLIGALAATRLHRRYSGKAVVIGINCMWAALLPLMLTTSNPALLGVIGGATAFLGPLFNVTMMNYQMVLVPEQLMGRVGSAAMTLAAGAVPVASIAAGYLLSGIGPTRTLVVLVAVMAATAVCAALSPAVRQAPPLPSADDLASAPS